MTSSDIISEEIVIRPTPPFRLDATVAILRRDTRNIVDVWDADCYCRVLPAVSGPCLITTRQIGQPDEPQVSIRIESTASNSPSPNAAIVQRMLGLDQDLTEFYSMAREDPLLRHPIEALRGLKAPRFPSVFEGLVNAIACQQISLAVGITLLGRLSRKYGQRLEREGRTYFGFPRPQDLAGASPVDLRELGFSFRKAGYILRLAADVCVGEIDLDSLEHEGNEEALAKLLRLPGIGRWSAEYVLLRGLGRLDVFPADDVGAAHTMARWMSASQVPSPMEMRQMAARWGRWQGLAYLHLLAYSLVERGFLRATSALLTWQTGP